MAAQRRTYEQGTEEITVKSEGAGHFADKDVASIGEEKIRRYRFSTPLAEGEEGFEQTAEAVGKGTEKAAERAVSAAKRASVEYKIVEHRREQQKLFADLGGRVYDLMKQSPQALSPKDPHIMATIDSLAMTAKKIAALEEEAGALKK